MSEGHWGDVSSSAFQNVSKWETSVIDDLCRVVGASIVSLGYMLSLTQISQQHPQFIKPLTPQYHFPPEKGNMTRMRDPWVNLEFFISLVPSHAGKYAA